MPSNMAAENGEPTNPPNQDSGSRGELPDPELNPMTNPILSRNLGKWAQVYFTSPPGKRAQAVAELLQELEGTSGGNGTAGRPATDDNLSTDNAEKNERPPRPGAEERAAHLPDIPGSPTCPDCGHINAPDHWFCGFCGSPLRGTALKRDHAEVPGSAGQGGNGSALVRQTSGSQPGDVEWLREKTATRYDAEPRRLRKVLLLTLAIAAIALSYYEWRSRAGAQTPAQAAPAVSTAPSLSKSQSAPSLGEANQSQINSSSSRRLLQLPHKPAEYQTGSAGLATIASNTQRAVGNTPQSPEVIASSRDVGDRELAIAESFLAGENRARDASEAAKWLWKSVSKDNAAALILLAGLYERGDGVSKSCDQAEILLVAAAKKGSSEAGQKLKNLQSSGCQ
jgi:hypothetical protein